MNNEQSLKLEALLGKPHYLWVGAAADQNLAIREGGRKILDTSRRGGAKTFRLDHFFQLF